MSKTLSRSYSELRSIKNVAEIGLLIAIAIVIHSFSIPIGSTVKISISFLPMVVVAYLYGPVASAMAAAVIDMLGNIFFPSGPYFPGFTLTALILGLIYGFILYQNPISVKRIIFARLTGMIIVSITLNTLLLTMIYGKAFFAILPARMLRNVITLAPECFMMYFVLNATKKIHK